ncbi:hypothetical protein CDL15_Pgr002686 [Punica granatum]|uniref:Uncharacterized protein n=1 Tax=Punica granatum TaxID=22663 RepID=A0A218VZ03_PUNGR|nr:hypothetical protein CDL15_Pgr002686 [Punica granatum]
MSGEGRGGTGVGREEQRPPDPQAPSGRRRASAGGGLLRRAALGEDEGGDGDRGEDGLEDVAREVEVLPAGLELLTFRQRRDLKESKWHKRAGAGRAPTAGRLVFFGF